MYYMLIIAYVEFAGLQMMVSACVPIQPTHAKLRQKMARKKVSWDAKFSQNVWTVGVSSCSVHLFVFELSHFEACFLVIVCATIRTKSLF